MKVKAAQSYLTLYDPMDCSPPDSTVYMIFQARILEWIAMPFSRGSSKPKDRTRVFVSPSLQADSLPTELPWKPIKWMKQIRLFSDSFEKATLSSNSQ